MVKCEVGLRYDVGWKYMPQSDQQNVDTIDVSPLMKHTSAPGYISGMCSTRLANRDIGDLRHSHGYWK